MRIKWRENNSKPVHTPFAAPRYPATEEQLETQVTVEALVGTRKLPEMHCVHTPAVQAVQFVGQLLQIRFDVVVQGDNSNVPAAQDEQFEH